MNTVVTRQFVNSRSTKKLPNRLPKYPVPEQLKRCVVENNDVTNIAPSLLKVKIMHSHCLVYLYTLIHWLICC